MAIIEETIPPKEILNIQKQLQTYDSLFSPKRHPNETRNTPPKTCSIRQHISSSSIFIFLSFSISTILMVIFPSYWHIFYLCSSCPLALTPSSHIGSSPLGLNLDSHYDSAAIPFPTTYTFCIDRLNTGYHNERSLLGYMPIANSSSSWKCSRLPPILALNLGNRSRIWQEGCQMTL